MMDEVSREISRQYYAAHRFEILARRSKLRWLRKHHHILKTDLSDPYGIPEDVVRQMLTLNLEENEEKTSEENHENAMQKASAKMVSSSRKGKSNNRQVLKAWEKIEARQQQYSH